MGNIFNEEKEYLENVKEIIGLNMLDTGNVTDTTGMFRSAHSKKIYAKSEKEKEIFESSVTKKPSSVIVEIKK